MNGLRLQGAPKDLNAISDEVADDNQIVISQDDCPFPFINYIP